MIDIKLIRENPELIRSSQRGRGEDESIVDRLLELDTKRRDAIAAFEALRAEQNILSKSVGAAKGDEKNALLEQAKSLAAKVKDADSKRAEIEAQTIEVSKLLSNVLDPDAPIGGEADFKVIEHVGEPRKFDFEPKDHVELGKLLGAIDTERGAKVAGARQVQCWSLLSSITRFNLRSKLDLFQLFHRYWSVQRRWRELAFLDKRPRMFIA